jgi:hypothetical protein
MPDETIHAVRVTYEREVYRDFEVRGSESLYNFAKAIVAAFDFDFDHAFGFFAGTTGNIWRSPVRYELFADMGVRDGAAKSVKRTKVEEAFPKPGSKMRFLFDYGDEWQFKVEVTAMRPHQAGTKYPRVVKAVGEAPSQYGERDDA